MKNKLLLSNFEPVIFILSRNSFGPTQAFSLFVYEKEIHYKFIRIALYRFSKSIVQMSRSPKFPKLFGKTGCYWKLRKER